MPAESTALDVVQAAREGTAASATANISTTTVRLPKLIVSYASTVNESVCIAA
jgi:hypothetical protein